MTARDRESLTDIWALRDEKRIRQFARTLSRDELLETVVFLTDALRDEKTKNEDTTPTFTRPTPSEMRSS